MTLFLKSRFLSAVKSGKTQKVKDYLTEGADPNSTDGSGYTALMLAAAEGHMDIIEILFEHGVDVNQTAKIRGLHGSATEGYTPLMAACGDMAGHTAVIKRFLRAGAQVNALDSEGMGAMMCAVSFGHLEAVKILIKAGANVKLKYGSGKNIYTLIHVAKQDNYTEIVDHLIAAGAPEK
ncbi:MAG: ankyrin repeat domain-containing protein [Candidatus Aminicenantes bacterium]|nr:ankyrin repeat domain-containing protein [Candidatus Aminicenantes bacterium]